MVFAQEGANDQHPIELAKFGQAHAKPGSAAKRGLKPWIRTLQPRVNVLGAQRTGEHAEQAKLFKRGHRRSQSRNLLPALLGSNAGELGGHELERLLPVGFSPRAIGITQHGARETIFAVEPFVGKTIAVRNPALVHRFIFERHHTHDLIVFDLHHEVSADAIVRTYRTAAGKLPSTSAVAEGLRGERTHRANINHVARELGLNCTPHK